MTALTLALACFVAPGPVEAGPVEAPRPTEGVTLRYRFAPGEVVRYRAESEATFLARKGDLTEKNASKSSSEHHYEVVAVASDGTATLRLAIDRVRMQAAFNDQTPVAFDSDSAEEPASQFRGVRRSVGKPLAELRVLPNGKTIDARRLTDAEPDMPVNGATGPDGETTGVFTVFPERPLRPGDEWSDTFKTRVSVTARLSREVTLIRRYRLETVERGAALVSVRSALLTPIDDPQLLVQLIQRQFVGTVRFDLASGRVTSRTTEADNTEIGWADGDGSLRAVSQWTERLIDAQPAAVSLK